MFGQQKKSDEDNLIRIGKSILRESNLEIPVEYKGEVFTLKYPTPSLMGSIEVEVARRLGGYPRESYSFDHVSSIQACVTVDYLFIPDKCPKWFTGPWQCYDEELIGALYAGYLHFRDKFRDKLRTGGFEEDSKGSST